MARSTGQTIASAATLVEQKYPRAAIAPDCYLTVSFGDGTDLSIAEFASERS